MLKSKKLRIALGVVATLILIVGAAGFALTRGYLIHFLIDDQTISRDAFYQNAFAPADEQIPTYCAQGDWTLGWLYVYEVHCFSTQAAVDTYMQQHFGSS